MKYLYTAYTWIFGGIYFFVITIVSIIILTFVPTKKYIRIFRFFLRLMFTFLFVRVRREYLQPIDFNQRYIYMPNHVSILDAPICSAYMPEFITALEAVEHFKWPFYGLLAKLYGNIPIDRKSIKNSVKSLQIAQKVLEGSNSMVIFPEGSRTEDGSIGRFKRMPFQLAKDANVGIVPVGMSGVFTLNKKHSMLFRPSRIKLKFGNVIPAEKVAAMSHQELMEHTYNEVSNLIEFN